MKKTLIFIFLGIANINFRAGNMPSKNAFTHDGEKQSITFTENKGQVSDQNYKPRPDVLFGGMANGLTFHLLKDGISYQLNRVESRRVDSVSPTARMHGHRKIPDQISISRLDVRWPNCNKDARIEKGAAVSGYCNYYNVVCPDGALFVQSYQELTYKDLYDGIDLHYYEKNGELEYDYIVGPGSDYKEIVIEIQGAEKLLPMKNGSVLFVTALGNIVESRPIVYQEGKELPARWVLNGRRLSFEIEGRKSGTRMIIDPVVRIWGTYFGGFLVDWAHGCENDSNGDLLVTGLTANGGGTLIATSGAYDVTLSGQEDAFLSRWSPSGQRIWSTYYGGPDDDGAISCAIETGGNIYFAGFTHNATGTNLVIPTTGAHQAFHGGGTWDAMLVKFNSSGFRIWGTFYGSAGNDQGIGCDIDPFGNVFLSGYTQFTAGNGLVTTGAHQTTSNGGTFEAYVAKFNSAGVRQWGTYYGGSQDDFGWFCAADPSGNVYLCGYTDSNSGTAIATPGSHQPAYGGGFDDAFLVKFNSAGVRQWGTYAGAAGYDISFACLTDQNGNVYLTGSSDSPTAGTIIATPGTHQSTHASSAAYDGFIIKYNSSGIRQWGTYFGGSGKDVIDNAALDPAGWIYISGHTGTTSGTTIATPGSHQTTGFASPWGEAFLAKFDLNGNRIWGTYYGGFHVDIGSACSYSGNEVYMVGSTTSLGGTTPSGAGTLIATPGAHQTSFTGPASSLDEDAFIVKFNECATPIPINATPMLNQIICSNKTTTLNATAPSSIMWFVTATSTAVIGTGPTFITPTLSSGIVTYYAGATNTCDINGTRIAITITVNPNPTVMVNSGIICAGQSFTINPVGASTYTVSGGNMIVSPTITSSYSVVGTNTNGCVSALPAVASVTVNALPQIIALGSPTLICEGETVTITASGAATYTWNNGTMSSSISVQPPGFTTYTVTGTDPNGCQNSFQYLQFVEPCLGVTYHDADQGNISVFPNPSEGHFIINMRKVGESTYIRIYNSLGQLLTEVKAFEGDNHLDLRPQTNGVYFLIIFENQLHDPVRVIKLVKQ